jgi:hypothetical protein
VYRTKDLDLIKNPPADASPDSSEYEAWLAACDRALLFDDRLGSGASIGTLWSQPAQAIGLPLIARIYNDESLEVSRPDLQSLDGELDRLVEHWTRQVPDDGYVTVRVGTRELQYPQLVDLMLRADAVRAAIRIAARVDGTVIVS